MLQRIVIETLPCLECGASSRIEHDHDLLIIPGKCSSCGKVVEFRTDSPLRVMKLRLETTKPVGRQ